MESADGKHIWALRDVSLQIRRGEILGIIGRNGAGKSTLLKVLSRITAPTQGVVRIKGRIASLLEVGTGFHPELTGRENVFLNGTILGMTRAEIRRKFDDIVDFAEVGEFIDTPVKRYSSGMYVRLAFAVAAHLEPDVLIVDEVLAVGDMAFQQKCLGKMDDVAQGGRTVIFVSHNMAAIAQLTRRCLVFDHGVLQHDGATAEAVGRYMESMPRLMLRGRTPVSSLECQAQCHGGQAAAIVEVGLCERSLDGIPIGGSVELEIMVETWTAQDHLRFGYSVNDATGIAVLSGFSPAFLVTGAGRHLLALTVNRLPLCPGTYSLSVSVGTGGLHEPKREQHSLIGFGKFEVVPAMSDSRPVGDWRIGWGRVVHTDSSVGLLRCGDESMGRAG
jgi:lipopolysaccharide transport system ATP-binding protein